MDSDNDKPEFSNSVSPRYLQKKTMKKILIPLLRLLKRVIYMV